MTKQELAQNLNLHWFNPDNKKDVCDVENLISIISEMLPLPLMQELFSDFLKGKYWR